MAIVDKERIRNLHPAYFALVMATSIVAIACRLEALGQIPGLLTGLNAAIFILLSSLTLARLGLFRREMHNDLKSHARAPGFLTIPAGSASERSHAAMASLAFTGKGTPDPDCNLISE